MFPIWMLLYVFSMIILNDLLLLIPPQPGVSHSLYRLVVVAVEEEVEVEGLSYCSVGEEYNK